MNIINSLLDNIKEKTTNPFFGSLIFVWCIRNWELIYTLFNFDKDCTLADKKFFIIEYYRTKTFWEEFFINFLYAFCLLLLGYFFVIISRVLINIVYHNIIPFFNKHTVSKLVVDSGRFETVRKQRDDYFKEIEEISETLVGLQQRNSKLERERIEIDTTLDSTNKLNAEYNKKNQDLINANSELSQTINDNVKRLYERNDDIVAYDMLSQNHKYIIDILEKSELNPLIEIGSFKDIYGKKIYIAHFPEELLPAYRGLIDDNLLAEFFHFAAGIKYNDGHPYYLENINLFEGLGLVREMEQNTFSLTSIGERLYSFKKIFNYKER